MQGYSGNSFDRFVEQRETSTLYKFKETFWTTKQAVIQKLGKKEDEHVVASDAELDAKLEVFKAIQQSCMELLRVIEKYQDRTCALSMEENATGRFLKANSGQDKTRAGKMMAAVGKSQSFSAQQRLALRVPLVRLYLEVETFRYRAISDTLMTINRMEGARTEYRGALLWMKDVSEQLDPDTYKQLEKFRKVQAQVKKTKSRFDKLKLDVMQKIDLLAASRCNMFSHVLANYQSSLLHFWEKTSRTMTAVAESFKGYQYYEWNVIKELQEPARRLSQSSNKSSEHDIDDDFDPEKLITLEEEASEQKDNSSLQNLYSDKTEENRQSETRNTERTKSEVSAIESFMDFGTDMSESLINLDLKNKCPPLEKRTFPSNLPKDLLGEELDVDNQDKDDMAILNEILNAPPAGDDDFSQEWQTVFGQVSLGTGLNLAQGDSEPIAKNIKGFMPSDLLDLNQHMTDSSKDVSGGILSPTKTGASVAHQKGSHLTDNQSKPTGARPKQSKTGQKSDISAWFNLFADLDPLADPDAVGKKVENTDDACMG